MSSKAAAESSEGTDCPYQLVPGHVLYDSEFTSASRDLQHRCVIQDATGYLIPGSAELYGKLNSDEFTVLPEDIWLLTYPKCGTTWTWEILMQLLADGNLDDVRTLRDRLQGHDASRIELKLKGECERIRTLNSCEPPRIFGSHLPIDYVPQKVKKTCQIIVVMRNPKDACVSFYHFHRMNGTLGGFSGSFSQFYQAFVRNQAMYGSWFDHTIHAYERYKNNTNFLFLKFEDIKKDPRSAIVKIANHIKKSLSEDDIQRIVDATEFKNLKQALRYKHDNIPTHDRTKSEFMRKGEVGDWKNHFIVADSEHFDDIYTTMMKDTDLEMEFE